MAIESPALLVSLLRDWVKLFMCNHTDVKKVMEKLPNKKTIFTDKVIK